MRSRTKQEIMRGYAKLREDKARKRRRPFQIIGAVLVLGAAGKLVVTYHAQMGKAASAASAKVAKWADDMRNPSNYAGRTEGAVPPPDAPVPLEGAYMNKVMTPDSPQAPASPAPPQGRPGAVAPAPAKPKPPSKNEWRVSGTVYDLGTLLPVPNAEISFIKNEKEAVTARTDEKGAYTVDLAKETGWTVSMKAPNHRRGQILDLDPPYRIRDTDERRAVLEHITDGDLTPAPVGWKRGESTPRLDIIALPLFWADAPPP